MQKNNLANADDTENPTSAQFGPPRWEDVGFLVSAGFTQIADLNTSKKAHSHTGELFFFRLHGPSIRGELPRAVARLGGLGASVRINRLIPAILGHCPEPR